MEDAENTDVNNAEETAGEESDSETNNSNASEGVENTEEKGGSKKTTAEELLGEEKRILVDKTRFDDRNEKAKLYETFAPVIEQYKNNPEKLKELLGTKDDKSVAEQLAEIQADRAAEKRARLTQAVNDGLANYKHFKESWPEIKEQVEGLIKRGVSESDAIRRSYLGLHPEEHQADAQRRAQQAANDFGSFSQKGSRAPNVIDNSEDTGLSENETKVAQSLIGKDFGGQSPFKSEADYAKALKRHEAHLRATGFYDI